MAVKKTSKKKDTSPIYICFNALKCNECKHTAECPRYKAQKEKN